MEKLYLIMDEFLQVEYRQKALLHIVEILEASYSEEEQEKEKLLTSSVKWALEDLQKQVKVGIRELDNYIALAAGRER